MNSTIIDSSDAAPDWREELGATIGYAESYVERKIQIAKLDVAEKSATIGATLATSLMLVILAPVVLIVLSIALGFLLSELLDISYAAGFFILTGVYTIIGILIYVFRRQLITNPILSSIVKEMFKD